MRDQTKTYLYCVKADNSNDLNDQVQSFCHSHNVTKITPYPDFLVYIEYTETVTALETHLEELERDGKCNCGDCPLLEVPKDGRRKKLTCTKSGKMRWKTSPACEHYYETLKGALNEDSLSEPRKSDGSKRVDDCRPAATDPCRPFSDVEPLKRKDEVLLVREGHYSERVYGR